MKKILCAFGMLLGVGAIILIATDKIRFKKRHLKIKGIPGSAGTGCKDMTEDVTNEDMDETGSYILLDDVNENMSYKDTIELELDEVYESATTKEADILKRKADKENLNRLQKAVSEAEENISYKGNNEAGQEALYEESNEVESDAVQNEADQAVYWTPSGKNYHVVRECSALARSKVVNSGTIAESGKSNACDKCLKYLA